VNSRHNSTAAPPAVAVWKADLALVAITAIWGSTFVVVKEALAQVSPLVFNAIRMALAAGLLALWFRRRRSRYTQAILGAGALLGLFMAAGYAFQTEGLLYTTASKAAFLTGMSVVLVPLFSAAVFRRRLQWPTVAGGSLALAGLYLLAFSGAGGRGWWAPPNRGDLLVLLCAVAFAGHIIALGEYSVRYGFRRLAVLQVSFCGVFIALLVPFAETPRVRFSPWVLAAFAITAVLATALAFTVQAWAQQFTPANHTAIVFALEPVFAWATGVAVMHDHLRPREVWGALLILLAVVSIELHGKRSAGNEPAPASVPD
jgi:drug/metabolite transporter (DMT)-like permease